MAKWDGYTAQCDICGHKLEGYAEHETVCGACLDDIEADDESEMTA